MANDTIEADAVAVYECNQGYQLLGPSKKVCQEDGKWMPEDDIFCYKENLVVRE